MKPAYEPVILARKPGPMRELGIEECRIAPTGETLEGGKTVRGYTTKHEGWTRPCNSDPESCEQSRQRSIVNVAHAEHAGRWPANLVLECTCDETREGTVKTNSQESIRNGIGVLKHGGENARPQHSDTGGETIRRGYGADGKEPVRIHTDPNCPCARLSIWRLPGAGSRTHRRKAGCLLNDFPNIDFATGGVFKGPMHRIGYPEGVLDEVVIPDALETAEEGTHMSDIAKLRADARIAELEAENGRLKARLAYLTIDCDEYVYKGGRCYQYERDTICPREPRCHDVA